MTAETQTYLVDMYGRHGFVRDGDEFLDDGIPHVPMARPGGRTDERLREELM